jgi:hypothetical protein
MQAHEAFQMAILISEKIPNISAIDAMRAAHALGDAGYVLKPF